MRKPRTCTRHKNLSENLLFEGKNHVTNMNKFTIIKSITLTAKEKFHSVSLLSHTLTAYYPPRIHLLFLFSRISLLIASLVFLIGSTTPFTCCGLPLLKLWHLLPSLKNPSHCISTGQQSSDVPSLHQIHLSLRVQV